MSPPPRFPSTSPSGTISSIDLELLRDYQAHATVSAQVDHLVSMEKLLACPDLEADPGARDGLFILCDHLALQLALTPAQNPSERLLQQAMLHGRSARYPGHIAFVVMLGAAREPLAPLMPAPTSVVCSEEDR